MWGVVPAAGLGSRIQPLAFSKELLPIGSRVEQGIERPRAVSEYLIERMIAGGATRICVVVAPGKSDIMEYFGAKVGGADLCYAVQPSPAGLCDALFRAMPFIGADEQVLVGLPDTVWFPVDGLRRLSDGKLSFLLFPVESPASFDAVVIDEQERVKEIQVKCESASTRWVWGAFKLTGAILRELHGLWRERKGNDAYVGTLVNAWLSRGGTALGVRAGEVYVDVGTLHGYREAIRLLGPPMGGGGGR